MLEMLSTGAVGYLIKGADVDVVQGILAASRGEGVISNELVADVIGELGGRLARQHEQEETKRLGVSRIQHAIQFLTDVVMPGGMTGRDLAWQLEQLRPGVPVLFMSGYNADAIAPAASSNRGSVSWRSPSPPLNCYARSAPCCQRRRTQEPTYWPRERQSDPAYAMRRNPPVGMQGCRRTSGIVAGNRAIFA